QYEQYLLAYDAFIYLGRACQLLAEYADRAEAEKFWIQCFASIGKAKGLLTDPESRRNEAVRDLAVRAYYWEVKARLSYGDTKSGVAAVREYQKAYRLAEDLFKIYPQSRKEDMGKAILLEQAKAYCKAGEVKKGIELLQRIKLENPGTQIEDFAVDILGEFAGEDDLKLAIESADNIFSRGVTWLYKALQKYRRALSAIKTEAERKAWFPYCWLKIAECYFHLGRYHEAAAACSVIVYDRSPWLASEHAQKAALTKLDALNRLAKQTKDSADQRALNEYNTWAASQPAIRDLLGDGPTYNAAIDLETRARTAYEAKNTPEAVKNYLEAVRLWEQVAGKPGSTYRTIAIFSIGFDYYNAGDIVIREVRRTKNMPDVQKAQRTKEAIGYWDKALARFAEYLAAVERTAKDDKVTRYSIGAIFYSCIIHSDPEKNQPGKALDISEGLEKKYPNADPKLVMSILARRIEAKLRMDDNGLGWCPECKVAVKPESGACPKCKKAVRSYLDEAEEDMQALKNRYEKEGSGRDNYLRALIIVAQKLEQKAYDLRTENPAFAKELMIRAANYWYVFYTTNTEPFKGDQLEAIAEKLFFAAEERLERAGKETDDDARAKTLAQAKDLFGKARVLFETFLAEFGSTLPPERSKAVKRMITRAAVKSGEFKKAIDSLLEIIGKETVDSTTQGSVWEDLADCYFAQAKEMPLGDDKLKLFQKADNIYATLASSLMQGNRIGEDFYRLAAKHAASLWFYDPDKLDKFFTAMDGRGYGRRFACEKCRQVMSGAQLKGASACLFDRCTVCGTAVKRGTAPTCPACKGAVQPCDGAGFLQVAWDDQLRHECAASFVCRHWRCGNAPREYRLRCPKSGCGFETASERPVADCPKCKTKLDLTGFRKFLCGKCDCPLEMENAGGPAQDCPTHYKCGKCRRGSLKPGACPCGGALAECACGGKQTLAPLCVACESRADIRRAKCAKCGDLFLPRWLKDKTKCPKDGGDLTETWEPLALAGCGKRFAPQFVDDLKRMKCSACEKSYPPDRNLERTGSCPDEKCPAAGKGRLIDLVECDKCRKFGTVMQIRAWSAEDCQPGAFCDEFESWRALVVKRVPNKDRPPEPSSRHVHPQTLKEESQLTGGKK
ncbi:MAG: hypothetical protein HYY17_01950, partial [Planctomycetes bacterium]|nr:hypothetical protein [Planctomycetota bacterium]